MVLSWGLATAAGAADGAVGCGSVITEDTVLTSDLLDCVNGVTVTAPDVSLDLAGHQIRGRGAGEGVRVSASGVEVKGGVISGFRVGIVTFGGHELRIHDNTIHHNQTGLDLFLAIGAEVVGNRILNNSGGGVHTVRADESLLQRNLIKGNGGDGALLFESVAIVSGNTFSDNGGHEPTIDEICSSEAALYRVGSNATTRTADSE